MAINTDYMNPFKWGIGKMSDALAAATIDPVKDLLYYAYPRLGASLSGRTEIVQSADYGSVHQILYAEAIDSLHREVKTLMDCAEIKGSASIYTGIQAPYEGNGSHLGHVLVVPLEDISRKNFTTELKDEPLLEEDALKKTKDISTDNEVRFQLSRALYKMKGASLLKIAARVAILALAIGLFFSPFGWLAGLIVFAGASILYCAVDRFTEEWADKRAITILTKRFKASGYDPLEASIQATQAAVNALKKAVLQNLGKREKDKLFKMAITPEGNLRFDPSSPSLTRRIKALETNLSALNEQKLMLSKMTFTTASYC